MKPTGRKLRLRKTCLKDGTIEYIEADVVCIGPVWFVKPDVFTIISISKLWAKVYGFADAWPIINGWEYAYAEEE